MRYSVKLKEETVKKFLPSRKPPNIHDFIIKHTLKCLNESSKYKLGHKNLFPIYIFMSENR